MNLPSSLNRRGRPRRFSSALVSLVAAKHPEVRSERGQRNLLYAAHAVGALQGEPPSWIWGPGSCCTLVLVELGKVRDVERIRAFAKEIAAGPRPRNVAPLVSRIRAARGRVKPLGDAAAALAVVVLKAITRYRNANPEITEADSMEALRVAAETLQATLQAVMERRSNYRPAEAP